MNHIDNDLLEELIEDYGSFILSYPPTKAKGRLLRYAGGDEQLVEKVVAAYHKRTKRFIDAIDPRVIRSAPNIETSYPGPDFPQAWCWPNYKNLLLEKGWGKSTVKNVDDATTKILAHFPHPGEGVINTRGLVVGYVQSGKTANYTGVIAKAADYGFKLVIVLTGMTSSLRRQTQRRLDEELCAQNPENWNSLTSVSQDFQGVGSPDYLLNPKHRHGRVLCVVKKNVHILERIRSFFDAATEETRRNCPVLIIDDEADQASVNTRQKADERSAINRKIVEILEILPKTVYLGYTATPFANIFIDPSLPEDLYPRDFIVDLPRPRQYFGAERIFGREMLQNEEDQASYDGLDMVRDVPESDVEQLCPPRRDSRFNFMPSMTPSLERAILYFFLASACRFARGQERKHTSMLIHTTLYTHTHGQLQSIVKTFFSELEDEWTNSPDTLTARLREVWDEEHLRVTSSDLNMAVEKKDFDELIQHFNDVFESSEIVVDNGRIGGGLTYTNNDKKVHIAIGGNTLSRGLTLEGLIVSYFIRTASAYDTLLQMGRWFGYRPGYEDLPRVWMTSELLDQFIHLATVEEEIRNDIRRYESEGRSPRDFAVRVQTHPKLAVTSRLKMQNVKLASASYSDSHYQTFQFDHENLEWLQHNLQATRSVLQEAASVSQLEEKSGSRSLFRSVPYKIIYDFLEEYKSLHQDFDNRLLLNYLEKEHAAGGLTHWNIGIIGSRNRDTIDLGLDRPVHLVNRSRFQSIKPANIKALTTRADRIIDLDWEGELKGLSHETLCSLRNNQYPDSGLLLIYPIDKDSGPAGESKDRRDLNAADHVIGIGLSFPKSKLNEQDYLQNNLEGLFRGDELEAQIPEEADQDVPEDEEELEG
ncbi:hypothetical protein FRC98_02510 [Lujinxingia vulgaris]|uniref:Putative endonuclease Z1 domain-containing protein n=1 Tax=Lujinxingia vulgaris TaxID=2600176 RepID=A0A5C6XD35_9DELT|nr:Z1 domain-containing protein [Lujinxingia vulgaris]TXD39291.1 hypothetical protein FRC98_02510 [Lujinxingia vulgaris]